MPTIIKTQTATDSWLVVEGVPGLTIAPRSTPLTRPNYFDGKFLRASDLKLEQDAQRRLVHLSNLAGGFGVVYGFDTRLLAGDLLEIGAGQAIDADGRVLLLPLEITASTTELLARSQSLAAPPAHRNALGNGVFGNCTEASSPQPGAIADGAELWLVTIAHAEFLCGEEDVYGKLCEQACVTSTDRPLRIEGVVLRARPLALAAPLVTSSAFALTAKHLRSRVASAYFADERARPASLVSGSGLRNLAWCLGAALTQGEVALGVLARQGATNLWFDAWTARRERMEAPPRMYWAHRMAMRPWREFLAQILQFQCQLRDVLGDASIPVPDPEPNDPCNEKNSAIRDAVGVLSSLLERVPTDGDIMAQLAGLSDRLNAALTVAPARAQRLLEGGIVELPPAGYLPVSTSSGVPLERQVEQLLGTGLDLRYCAVRADDIPLACQEAQHKDRISLLEGLADPRNKPKVDILVPDGIADATAIQGDAVFELRVLPGQARQRQPMAAVGVQDGSAYTIEGMVRAEPLESGGASAGLVVMTRADEGELWAELEIDVNPFLLAVGQFATVTGTAYVSNAEHGDGPGDPESGVDIRGARSAELFQRRNTTSVGIERGSVHRPTLSKAELTQGRITVTQIQTRPRSVRFEADLSGILWISQWKSNSTEPQPQTQTHRGDRLKLRAEASMGATGLTVAATIAQEGEASPLVSVMLRWDSATQTAQALATAMEEETSLAAFARYDLGLLDPGNALASRARTRLDLIDTTAKRFGLPDPIQVTALERLFATSATRRGTSRIHPKHDWVLFRRRAEDSCCACERPAPVTAPAPAPAVYRYAVFAIELQEPSDLDGVLGWFDDATADGEPPSFAYIGDVEYEAGQSDLRTHAEAVAMMWKPQGEGRSLLWTAIASVGEAQQEGDGIAHARLLALEEQVEEISPAWPSQSSVVLARLPGALARYDAAGAMILVHGPRADNEAAQVILSLWFVESQAITVIEDAIEAGEVAIDRIIRGTKARKLGDFEFSLDRGNPSSVNIEATIGAGIQRTFLFPGSSPDEARRKQLEKQVSAAGEVTVQSGDLGSVVWVPDDSEAGLDRVIVFLCGDPLLI